MALIITKLIEINRKKRFVVEILNFDNETFVIYMIALLEPITILIYSFCKT